ncbi:MAG: Tripartite tricarboxylate transporter TctB family [Deltaproteobacteria bacterium]|jgi:hypothetical protein|nr:Tripartite tricarboxylate transporter TctB family [Deltaproteobacteria bacterium]
MKNREAGMAVFWILLGTTIAVWSSTFPFGNLEDPGPGYFPAAMGIIIAVIGILLLVQSRKTENANGGAPLTPRASRGPAVRRVVLYLAAMTACTVFLEILGFALAMFLMILFMMRTIAPQRWRTAVFYSLVSALGSLFLFKILLKTQLPSGFLRF